MYTKTGKRPNSKYRKVVVIGAGIGGLAAACLLAADGCKVKVLEKNQTIGGKMNQFEKGGFRFDTGPSLLTMPGVLRQLFEYCGAKMEDYLDLVPLSPLCRYHFPDGTSFNAHSDLQQTLDEIQKLAPEDLSNYKDFLDYARQLYNLTADVFLFHPLRSYTDLLQLPLRDFFRADAFRTVSGRVDKSVESPYLRQFFKRFATYNGSSPFQVPATINVISHVEMNMGGYYVQGGLYQIALALEKLAESLGVTIKTDVTVRRVEMNEDLIEGVTTDEGYHVADLVVSNADAHHTYLDIIPHYVTPASKRRQIDRTEPSCSGFVFMLGTRKRWEQLGHHTIFFSRDYRSEFEDIFRHKRLPSDPTIYIANTSVVDSQHAIEGGSNLFILVNSPYLDQQHDWDKIESEYVKVIISELEKRGLHGLSDSIVVQETITPRDFFRKYRSNRGSIYGTSSNSRLAAFMRPRNRSPYVENLWLVGGSTHPGGGIPLCVISAFHACDIRLDSSKVE